MVDARVSEEDLATIAREYLTRWKEISPYLGITAQEEEEICESFRSYGDQKREALKLWKRKKGKEATYGAFIAAAKKVGNADLADEVEKFALTRRPGSLASDSGSPSCSQELSKCSYLQNCSTMAFLHKEAC